jgi:3-deoxy-D-manno-octulosonic-acid transferase
MNTGEHPRSGTARRPLWWIFLLAFYQILLPTLLLLALPGWILKMLRRGGKGSGLNERAGFYSKEIAYEPCGAIHVHAVSVGEAILALQLIRTWRQRAPDTRFVLAVGTATGHAVASKADIPGLRVTYAPLDLPFMVANYLRRFEPSSLVLVEGEVWPNLLAACGKHGIPVSLVNARMSPRSERRYQKLAPILHPLFSQLHLVALQEDHHRTIWQRLGVAPDRIHLTGSLKFDPGSGHQPERRTEFEKILSTFGSGPVLLAASTHIGEEAYLASAMHQASPHARLVIAPRHAERAADAVRDLTNAGFSTILRSSFKKSSPTTDPPPVLLIDTTGELRDWTAHASLVLIGKSFLSTGGQNPTEAILADVPVIFGPHMENFEPLASQLVSSGGALRAHDAEELTAALRAALDPAQAARMVQAAHHCLQPHEGAIQRVIDLLEMTATHLRR